jgi:hypothetical protein
MAHYDLEKIIGTGRGARRQYSDKFSEIEPPRLSEILADRVCGKHNQDAILLCVGQRGSGKSHFLLNLAVETAKRIAEKKGGSWEDYFSPEENVAVISGEQIVEKLQNLKRLQVVILDDVGADAMNARSFMSKENRDLSAILQICRTERNTLLISTPQRELADVNIGRLSAYFCEISESLHDHGLVLVKVFTQKPQFRSGKMFYPYLRWGKHKIVRFVSGMPPADIFERYDKIRDEQARQVAASQRAEKEECNSPGKREQHWQELESQYGDEVTQMHNEGISDYLIGKEIGLSKDTVARLISRQRERESI